MRRVVRIRWAVWIITAGVAVCWAAARGRTEETVGLTFRVGDGKPGSLVEDVNVVQSNRPNDIARFWTRRQPNAAVDRYVRGTSDSYYLVRFPMLFGVKNSQLPADPALIIKATLRLVRIPTAGYVPEGWQVPDKKNVAFTVHRLADPDGFGPWRMPSEGECPPRSRIPFVGVCGAFRDGRASFHDPRKSVLIPAGRPWRGEVAAGLDAGVLIEECTAPYSPTSLVYEFDVTRSVRAWAGGALNDGWAIHVSKDTNVSFRGDLLFHTSLAENEADRPQLTVVVKPRPFDHRWQAVQHVPHPFYRTPEEIARAKRLVAQHAWAKDSFSAVLRAADVWAGKTEADLELMIPSKDDERHTLDSAIYNQGGLFDAAATAYALTGDQRYARPVARVLIRIAQAWPHWPVVGEDGTAATAGPGPKMAGPPYAPAAHRGIGKWGEQKLLLFGGIAYDLIYDSGALEEIGREERFDAKGFVEQELFRKGAQFLLDHQIGYGNFDGYLTSAMLLAARNSGDPLLVHRSVEVLDLLLINSFVRDGMWFEACGYHGQTCNLRHGVEALRGYSDPPAYQRQGQHRFDNLDPYHMWPALRNIYRATLPLCYPDRDCLYVNDTSTGEFWDAPLFRVAAARYGDRDLNQVAGNDLFLGPGETKDPAAILPELSHSWLLPGAGYAILRAGPRDEKGPAGQSVALLSFGDAATSHDHSDGLNLGFFGKGRELAADLGYTHTYLRCSWPATTAGHNTVLIDGKLQEHGRGNLVFFCSDADPSPAQVVEAAMPRAYPSAKRYSRCVALMTPTHGTPYVVDFFRVEGGQQHDFMFHGPATHHQKALAVNNVPLAAVPGTLAGQTVAYAGGRKGTGSQYDNKDWYSYITDVGMGPIAAAARCRWEYDDASGVGLAAIFLPGTDAQLWTGTAPNLRLADGKTSNYTDRQAIDRNRMPVLCIRRTAATESPLNSCFVSVLEPYQGHPMIRDATRLDAAEGIVGVKVQSDAATQYVFYGSDGRGGYAGEGEVEGIQFAGQFAALSLVGNEIEMLCLVGGGHLGARGWRIQHPGNIAAKLATFQGDLTGAKENEIVLAAEAPAIPAAFRGQVAVLKHRDGATSGFTITDVTTAGGATTLKLADQRAFLLCRFHVDRVSGKVLHTPQALRQAGDGWLAGKWLTVKGKTYRIVKVQSDGAENIYCRGWLVELEPEDGLVQIEPGDTCLVHAARPGDELILTHRTSIRKESPSRYVLRTTAPKLMLSLPSTGPRMTVRYRDKAGATRVMEGHLQSSSPGVTTVVIELEGAQLRNGETTLELVAAPD